MPHRSVAKTRTKEMPCRDCGTPLLVGMNTRNKPRCHECGIKASVQTMKEMKQREGPAWDHWVKRMTEVIAQGSRATPP